MTDPPDEGPPDEGPFRPRIDGIQTQWTLLRRAHLAGDVAAADAAGARRALVLRYAPAIRRYVGGIVRDDAAADELAQDVLVRLLRGDFAGADPDRGRFRDLLKTAVRNMVKNRWAKEGRRAHRPLADGDFDAAAPDPADGRGGEPGGGPDDGWGGGWRARVLELAWADLEAHQRDHPAGRAHTVLRLRADHPDASAAELAGRLAAAVGEPIRTDRFRQLLRRARVRFAESLVREVGDGLADPTPDRVEDELIALDLHARVRPLLPDGWPGR